MIQLEWIFLQRATNNTGDAFTGVEKILWEAFFASPSLRKVKNLSPIVVILSTTPVNKSGRGLLNSVTSEKNNYLSLQHAITELIQAMKQESAFYNSNQLMAIREEKRDG